MKEDIDAIKRNETWEWVDLPLSGDAIRVKWIHMLNYNHYESVKKHKEILIAKGYAQH